MTVTATTRKAGPFAGTGTTGPFTFSFKVTSSADVKVVRANASGAETTLALTTDYSVSVNADQNASPGGSVTLTSPLASGYSLVILGAVAYTQPAQLPIGGAFNATVVEAALDRLTYLTQQLLELTGRAVTVPATSNTDPSVLIAQLNTNTSNAAASASSAATSASSAATSASNAAASAASVGFSLSTNNTFTGTNTFNKAVNLALGASIASAATVNLDSATGNTVHVTGTTSITAITLAEGSQRTVVFDGALTLTNGASLVLPSGANITTAAGDIAEFVGESAGVVRCTSYVKANGQAVAAAAGGFSNLTVFTASGTWTVPAGVTKCKVTVVGGGGNGANADGVSLARGGGGGGAAIKVVSGLAPGGTVSVTVGGQGGTSSFGAHCSATGGASAVLGSDYTPAGGIGSGGDLNAAGDPGGSALTEGANGGGSLLGSGGQGRAAQGGPAAGAAGRAYGGGGGSGYNTSGGAGAPGVVVIEY